MLNVTPKSRAKGHKRYKGISPNLSFFQESAIGWDEANCLKKPLLLRYYPSFIEAKVTYTLPNKCIISEQLDIFDFNEFDIIMHWAALTNFMCKKSALPFSRIFLYTSFAVKEYFADKVKSNEAYKYTYFTVYEDYCSEQYKTVLKGIINSIIPVELNSSYKELTDYIKEQATLTEEETLCTETKCYKKAKHSEEQKIKEPIKVCERKETERGMKYINQESSPENREELLYDLFKEEGPSVVTKNIETYGGYQEENEEIWGLLLK